MRSSARSAVRRSARRRCGSIRIRKMKYSAPSKSAWLRSRMLFRERWRRTSRMPARECSAVTGKPWVLSWQVPERAWQREAEACMSRPVKQSVWKALRAFGISNRNRVYRPVSGKFLPGKTADTDEDPIQAEDVRAGRANGRMRKRKTGEHRSANGSSSRWRPLLRSLQSF